MEISVVVLENKKIFTLSAFNNFNLRQSEVNRSRFYGFLIYTNLDGSLQKIEYFGNSDSRAIFKPILQAFVEGTITKSTSRLILSFFFKQTPSVLHYY